MTLVGKIFTVLILIMSVAFLMLALTVFATHRNWRDLVIRDSSAPEGPGLKFQVEELTTINTQLREELERASDRLAIEQAARRYALAALQTKLTRAQGDLQRREAEFAELQAAHGRMVTALESNEENLKAITTENDQLRVILKQAQDARDAKFDEVVKLTDKVNELQSMRDDLEERRDQMLAQLSRMKLVLDRNGLDEFTPVVDIPPRVDGIVTAVGDKDLVEISIGSDDGLRKGHALEVFRNNSYLGRVVVQRTEPDKAVAKVLKEYRKGTIKKGDRVATKFS